TQQDPEHIGVEGGGVVGQCLLRERARLTLRARIVDGNVETAEAGHRLIDKTADVFFLPYVRPHEFRFRLEPAQFSDERVTFFLVPPGNDESGAFPGEREGGGTADARQGAG